MYFMEVFILKREFCYSKNISEKETKSEYFCSPALLVLIEYPSDAQNGYFLLSVLYKQTHIYQYCQARHTDELCKQP